jgi:hypothetical protein
MEEAFICIYDCDKDQDRRKVERFRLKVLLISVHVNYHVSKC